MASVQREITRNAKANYPVLQETLDACLSATSCHGCSTSAHRVYWSTMVKRYVMDSDSGSGPTMSTWRDPKRRSGRYMVIEVHGHVAILWRIGRGDMFGTSCGYRSSGESTAATIGVLDKASATTLSRPYMSCTSFVKSATKERCLV